MDYAQTIPNMNTSIYFYVNDNERDLITAINDMKIVESITPEFFERPTRIY